MSTRKILLNDGTPIEDHCTSYDLFVKREDLSAKAPGPSFSKTRGVYAHLANLPGHIKTIGVLDTYHSQAGHAVAHAATALGLRTVNYYPEYKYEPGYRAPQERAEELGAKLRGLKAGRSAILFHQAKKSLYAEFGEETSYMMPNALKLPEMVAETANEVRQLPSDLHPTQVLIAISSGTIAAGVIRGFIERKGPIPHFLLHMGYSRSESAIRDYLRKKVGVPDTIFDSVGITIIDEKYGYKDKARPGETPPWPCSPYYDLKAFRWWLKNRDEFSGSTLLWNIG